MTKNKAKKIEADKDFWLWKDCLIGKYAGKTLGDYMAEQFLGIERPFEDFPNCWVIYEKETKKKSM